MNTAQILRKALSLIKKPKRLTSAFSTAIQTIEKQLLKISDLPQGKSEIPPYTKATLFPLPVVICGTMVAGRANFNTLGNFGLISPSRPNPIVYISSSKKHYSNIGLRKNSHFSVNIASRSVMAQTDYLGVVSGHTTDKSNVLTVFQGRHKDAPCLVECPLNYVCKIIQHIEVREKDLFIAEIVESFVSSEFLTEKGIDIERMEPLLYTFDNFYRTPGSPVGKAYDVYNTYNADH